MTDKKYVIYLNEGLERGVAINTAAHLSAQFGHKHPEVGGQSVHTHDRVEVNGLPIFPNIILKVDAAGLVATIEKATSLDTEGKVDLFVYPEAGWRTATDEDYRAAIQQKQLSDIQMLGCLVFGHKNVVNRLSKKAKSAVLWS